MSTLFVNSKIVIDSFLGCYSLKASTEFIECADQQLTEQFVRVTGIKPGKNVCFSISEHFIGAPIYTTFFIPEKLTIGRKLMICLYINHNWNPVTILWKSTSGQDYQPHDTNIDCSDIEFSFESLDTELYLKQLYPNNKFPFQLKNLTYELVLNRLNMDATIRMEMKPGVAESTDHISNQIGDFINTYNIKSEKKGRIHGVIHNVKPTLTEKTITYEIDLGSAGHHFYKSLLKHLSALETFSRVVID